MVAPVVAQVTVTLVVVEKLPPNGEKFGVATRQANPASLIGVGTRRGLVVPSPSCENELSPQVQTRPSLATATENEPPAATATMVSGPAGCTGVLRAVV